MSAIGGIGESLKIYLRTAVQIYSKIWGDISSNGTIILRLVAAPFFAAVCLQVVISALIARPYVETPIYLLTVQSIAYVLCCGVFAIRIHRLIILSERIQSGFQSKRLIAFAWAEFLVGLAAAAAMLLAFIVLFFVVGGESLSFFLYPILTFTGLIAAYVFARSLLIFPTIATVKGDFDAASRKILARRGRVGVAMVIVVTSTSFVSAYHAAQSYVARLIANGTDVLSEPAPFSLMSSIVTALGESVSGFSAVLLYAGSASHLFLMTRAEDDLAEI